jgi:hypothetical protein
MGSEGIPRIASLHRQAATSGGLESEEAMKKKMKKLALAKETVRNLEDRDAKLVNGGISGSACTNPTCIKLCPFTKDC